MLDKILYLYRILVIVSALIVLCSCTEASDNAIDKAEEQQSSIEEKDAKVDLKYGEPSNIAVDVTVAELRKSPEKYHNLSVRITGYASFEFEEFSIYDTFFEYDKQRYGAYNGLNRGIWLSYTGEDIESLGGTAGELITASGVPVVIEGVFDKEIHGMYGEYAGAVTRINLIETVDDTIPDSGEYPKEKYYAIGVIGSRRITENSIREEHGLPQRIMYGTKK